MAMQTVFRLFTPRSFEKCVPGLLAVVSRKYHHSTSKLCSTSVSKNIIFSTPCVFPQSASRPMGEAVVPSFLEERRIKTHLCTAVDNRQFLDLDILKPALQRIYTPSTSLNKVKIYEEKHHDKLKTITDPLLRDCEIIHIPVPGQSVKKEAHRMINIRRRKMRIHKRKKLRKKMKFVWEKIRLRKEIRVETAFRIELLTQIDEAQSFSAEKHVERIIHKLRYHKRLPTEEERREQYRQLLKKNRSETFFIMPRFDD